MIIVYVKLDCGCCTEELTFKDAASADAAFNKAGYGNGVSIVDDAGVLHEGLDTFYGYDTDESAQENKGLAYLAELVTGQKPEGQS